VHTQFRSSNFAHKCMATTQALSLETRGDCVGSKRQRKTLSNWRSFRDLGGRRDEVTRILVYRCPMVRPFRLVISLFNATLRCTIMYASSQATEEITSILAQPQSVLVKWVPHPSLCLLHTHAAAHPLFHSFPSRNPHTDGESQISVRLSTKLVGPKRSTHPNRS
jgi:hypothetical protein